jgi:hypothetical protein
MYHELGPGPSHEDTMAASYESPAAPARPEDRAAWLTQAQIERYEWAKEVDPDAVRAFNARATAKTTRARIYVLRPS